MKQLPRALGFPCLPCFLSATCQYSLESVYAAAKSGCGPGLVFEVYLVVAPPRAAVGVVGVAAGVDRGYGAVEVAAGAEVVIVG